MTHLGGYNPTGDLQTWMPDIWGWLLLECDIRSVVDIGCGYGHNGRWFRDMGCHVRGVEGEPRALQDGLIHMIDHDYTQGPLRLEPYDLALALEFVEHVEERYEENFLTTMDSAQWILMSHAVPGQNGYHHVNCQPSDYWIERLESRGFDYHPETTAMFRSTVKRMPSEWGRPTLLFFGRKG